VPEKKAHDISSAQGARARSGNTLRRAPRRLVVIGVSAWALHGFLGSCIDMCCSGVSDVFTRRQRRLSEPSFNAVFQPSRSTMGISITVNHR